MGQKRLELGEYLAAVHHRGFVLGDFDCLIFTNTCWKILYDFGWADDWINKYHKDNILLPRKELREKFAHNTVVSAIDSRLARGPKIPPFGSLAGIKTTSIFVGYALGITLGEHAVFVNMRGLQYLHITEVEQVWVNHA